MDNQKFTTMARKYSPKASKKVEKVMHEFKEGKLKSGNSDRPVKSRKQAIAIGLSEARAEGAKVPKKASKKTAAKKTASKKTASKKTVPKKTAAKKTASKKTASKKSAGRKTARKKGS
jgi:hypothetical protein